MKTIWLRCESCGKDFEKPTKEYNRWIRLGRTRFYCCQGCANTDTKTTHTSIDRSCLFCGKTFASSTHKRHKLCCSVECAAKYAQSHMDVVELASTMKRLVKSGEVIVPKWYGGSRTSPMEKIERKCVVCGQSFMIKPYITTKTCGKSCLSKFRSELAKANPNCGGELHYRRFIYRGITMDSSWEVRVAKWMDERNIVWERDRKKHCLPWIDDSGSKRRYYPDFYLPDFHIYLDPKCKWKIEEDRPKILSAMAENHVTVVWGLVDDVLAELTKIYENSR